MNGNVKYIVFGVCVALLILGASVGAASATTWYVGTPEGDVPYSFIDIIRGGLDINQTSKPVHNIDTGEDFAMIQAAIDDVDTHDGHTIAVDAGTYYENVVVNKRLTIKSENGSDKTVVHAENPNDHVFEVTTDYVNINGFTIKESYKAGIYLYHADCCNISNNNCSSNFDGIYMSNSNNNLISQNIISNNIFYLSGVHISSSNSNTIVENNILNNDHGIYLSSSNNNLLYHNNFIDNTNSVYSSDSTNTWNSTAPVTYTYDGNQYTKYLGNYWDDHTVADADGDGIIDTTYDIDGDEDTCPLAQPFEDYITEEQNEIKFRGTAIEYHEASGFGAPFYWAVNVGEIISGPQPCSTQLNVTTYVAINVPWGYADPNIVEGDKIEVYGEYYEDQYGCVATLGGSEDYYIKKISVQEEWSDDIRITNNPADSINPRIAVDSNNNVHIVWEDNRDGNHWIYYTKLDNFGNTLIDDKKIVSLPFIGSNELFTYDAPSIAMDSNDNIHLAFIKYVDSAIYEVFYVKLDNNGNVLSGAKRVDNNLALKRSPDITVDLDNNVHIVWEDYTDYPTEVYYSKLDSSGDILINSERLTHDTKASGFPKIAVNSSNNIHVVSGGALDYYFPDIVIDSNDSIHNVWCSEGNPQWMMDPGIYYKKLDKKGNTVVYTKLIIDSDTATRPAIAIDSNDNVHVIWIDGGRIYYTTLDNAGDKLINDIQLTFDPASPWKPDIAMDSNDKIHITWQDDKDGNWEIYYKTNAIIGPKITKGWPMFRHDQRHTGYSTSTAPNDNNVAWIFETEGKLTSSPAIANNKVFVGSDDGKIYCLNESTGKLIWSYQTGDLVRSSPAVVNGKIFVGSRDHKIYCIDESTGNLIWSYETGDWVDSSPAVVNGSVFIGSKDYNIYCLDENTGQRIWNRGTSGQVFSSPSVADGVIYIGDNYGKIYALREDGGELIWDYTTRGSIESSPAVVNGKVYVGSFSLDYFYCFDVSGNLLWVSSDIGSTITSSPAVANGKVFVGSRDNKIYCLNGTNGDLIWSNETADCVDSSPAIANGKVFVGSYDNKIYALDEDTGELVWSYETGDGVWSSPAVANGKVFVGSNDGKVYAFGESIGPKIIEVDDDFVDDPPNHKWDTIQEGVSDANDGDTVLVHDGAYHENVKINKRLTIRSENGADSTIVRATNPDYHVFEVTADDVNISGFTVEGATSRYAIHLDTVKWCKISNSNCSGHWAIVLVNSSNNTIIDNNCSNNDVGIYLWNSSNNTLTGNNASNNWIGIELGSSSNNTLTENVLLKNGWNGVYLQWTSGNNVLYHNNFISNTACDSGTSNQWSDIYPSGGNYWRDYDEESEGAVDEKNGPNQDVDGSDGIVDTPFDISGSAGAKDNYPLMKPLPDLTFSQHAPPSSLVARGEDDVLVNTVDFTATGEDILVDKINIALYGSGSSADIFAVKIYKETGGDGFDPGVDQFISETVTPDVWIDSVCTVTLGTGGSDAAQMIEEGDAIWYIVFDIRSSATTGHTVGGKIASGVDINATGAESGETVIAQKLEDDPTELRYIYHIYGDQFIFTQHFKIGYKAADFVDGSDGMPEYVKKVGLYCEQAYHRYVEEWEFDKGIPCAGEYYEYYVSIEPVTKWPFADPSGETCPCEIYPAKKTSIKIDNDLSDIAHVSDLKSIVFHEYFHAVTHTYRPFSQWQPIGGTLPTGKSWVVEGTATLMGSIGPDYPDYYPVFTTGDGGIVNYLGNTQKDLRGFDYEPWLYWFFIAENRRIDFDNDGSKIPDPDLKEVEINDNIKVIRSVWVELGKHDTPILPFWTDAEVQSSIDIALNNANPSDFTLQNHPANNFDKSFMAFCKANYFTRPEDRKSDGPCLYPESLAIAIDIRRHFVKSVEFKNHEKQIRYHSDLSVQGLPNIAPIERYGAHYFEIEAPQKEKVVKVTFNGDDSSFFVMEYVSGEESGENIFMDTSDYENILSNEDADGTVYIIGRLGGGLVYPPHFEIIFEDVTPQTTTTTSSTILPTQRIPITTTIDPTTGATFEILWQGSTLNLTLLTPDGILIDPTTTDPNITHVKNATYEYYTIQNPASGNWTMNITAIDVPPEGENYTAVVYITTNLTFSLYTDRYRYDPDESINIQANLTNNGTPVTGASVQAEVQRPNGSDNITLFDDGTHGDAQANDGVYSNTYTNTSAVGTYNIKATADGTIDGYPFVRERQTSVLVQLAPDLIVSDITFSNNTPSSGDEIVINATIQNIGDVNASNFTVEFYDGHPYLNGTYIGSDMITTNVTVGEAVNVSTPWTAKSGSHNIFVRALPLVLEKNESNNIANKTIYVTPIYKLSIIAARTDNLTYAPDENVTIYCIVENADRNLFSPDIVYVEIGNYTFNLSEYSNFTGYYIGAFNQTSQTGAYNLTIYANETGYQNDTVKLSFEVVSTIVANFTFTPESPVVNQTITFNATPSTGNITTYKWNFSDGKITTTPHPIITHSYAEAGAYTVTLTVTDDDGLTGTTSMTVTVIGILGDLNHDGILTPADAAIALGLAASGGWDPAADVNKDNHITSLDALMIMQAAGGTIGL